MLVEILVLGRNERVGDELGHRLDREIEPTFLGVFGEQFAVRGMHPRHHRRLVVLQRRIVRQVLGEMVEEARDGADRDQEHQRTDREQESEKPDEESHRPLIPLARPAAAGRAGNLFDPRRLPLRNRLPTETRSIRRRPIRSYPKHRALRRPVLWSNFGQTVRIRVQSDALPRTATDRVASALRGCRHRSACRRRRRRSALKNKFGPRARSRRSPATAMLPTPILEIARRRSRSQVRSAPREHPAP